MTKVTPCAWCGRGIRQNALGRPRKYCRPSHRQRAYEARLLAERMGLGSGEALVSAEALKCQSDLIYVLESALTDVEQDLRRDPDDHERAFQHLYAATAGLRGQTLEPRALL